MPGRGVITPLFASAPQESSRGKRFRRAMALSFFVHLLLAIGVWAYPLFAIAVGLRTLRFADEEYDRGILITFHKPLKYPQGYTGFRPPTHELTPEEMKRAEARRFAMLEAAKRERERQREEAARREKEEKAKEQEAASKQEAEKANQTTPADGYAGGFGKINTQPIKDQIQKLYEAQKAGLLDLQSDRIKVGVSGRINADGTLSDYKVIIPSGNADIDRAALVILRTVSDSRALGPLHELTSLSLILDIDTLAQLTVVGFTANPQSAMAIEAIANLALMDARKKKSTDPAAMIILNNVKVSRTGQRIQAVISMPRQKASDALADTMEKEKS
jgi:hypothetical protein